MMVRRLPSLTILDSHASPLKNSTANATLSIFPSGCVSTGSCASGSKSGSGLDILNNVSSKSITGTNYLNNATSKPSGNFVNNVTTRPITSTSSIVNITSPIINTPKSKSESDSSTMFPFSPTTKSTPYINSNNSNLFQNLNNISNKSNISKREDRLSTGSTSSVISSGGDLSSPIPPPRHDPHKQPPPPPPRTSSKSPLMSPAGPLSPAFFALPPKPSNRASTGSIPGGLVATSVGGVLRNAEGRELYGPVLKQRPPLGRGSFSEDSTASTASTTSSSSGKAGQLSSNSSSTESVNSQNSQEGISKLGGKQKDEETIPKIPPPKIKQEKLEQRHLELLRRQKQLQEQYQRLQTLQRSGGRIAPVNIDLKKTGSESNIASRLGLSLPPSTHGSLSNLSAASGNNSYKPQYNTLDPKTTRRNSGGLVETDIL